jgi:hypothetical protein
VLRPVDWSSGISKFQACLRKGIGWLFLTVGIGFLLLELLSYLGTLTVHRPA